VNGGGFCCDDAPGLRAGAIGNGNDNPEIYQYYYHSDHLGSTSLITNLDGEIVQHVEYVPFGEVFIEERNNKWNTPYLFNAKELDEETGLYYYGVRYYDSRNSVFLGVDPMWEKYPGISVFAYCNNNPINAVDPDGRFVWFLIPVVKGVVGGVIDAAAQATVSMANGQSFGEAMSNIDYTSVGASALTSALTVPGMSTTAKVATVAAVALDAAVDVSNRDLETVVTGDKSVMNAAIDVASSVLPGKAVDGLTSSFNKIVTSDLTAASAATMTKETKSGLKQVQAKVNSTAVQTAANSVAEYTGKLIGGQANKSIATSNIVSAPSKDPIVQQSDATRVQQCPIYPIYQLGNDK
jgi:RHS repeat-associated protein